MRVPEYFEAQKGRTTQLLRPMGNIAFVDYDALGQAQFLAGKNWIFLYDMLVCPLV